jgi:hypothetical protein
VAEPGDTVLLSGWSRRRQRPSEAELMREAWSGHDVRLVVDGDARTTAGNVRAVAAAAREHAPTEVVLVTSSWHARRARHFLADAVPRGVPCRIAVAGQDRPARLIAREVALYLVTRTTAPLGRVLRRRVRSLRRSPRA